MDADRVLVNRCLRGDLGAFEELVNRHRDVVVRVAPRYYRPTEVETLLGDPSKAREKLGWTPKTTLPELVAEMVDADYASARRDSLVKLAGFQAYDYHE